MHEGHRQRMYERLASGEKLQEHELLEVLLYAAIPRRNTNDLAHRLLSSFGSLQEVLHADMEKLVKVEGIGESTAAYLRVTGICLERILDTRLSEVPSAYSFDKFSKYLKQRFAEADCEYIELYAVRKNGTMIFCQRYTSEETDKVRIPPEEIARFVSVFHPKDVLLVHNHLCANFNPSAQDDYFTKYVSAVFSFYGAKLLDHIIISPAGMYSYHSSNRMEEIRSKYSAKSIMEAIE